MSYKKLNWGFGADIWVMVLIFLLIPLLAMLVAMSMNRHNGKKELLKLDLVQFMYSFVIFPLMFVWLKSFLFYLMNKELNIRLSVTEIFVVDTLFTIIFLYVFAFGVIHAVTKSFSLKSKRDPLYDIFGHSEYYHLWLSHVGVYVGTVFLTAFLAILNIFVPFQIAFGKVHFYLLLGVGFLFGLAGFSVVWITEIEGRQFFRLMKLVFGVSFATLVWCYFVFDPDFSSEYSFYWFVFMASVATVLSSYLIQKSRRATNVLERVVGSIRGKEKW